MSIRRVVVTGVGAICSLGSEITSIWNCVLDGKSGIRFIDEFDINNFPVKFAGTILNFDKINSFNKNIHKYDFFVQYGVFAADNALKDSKLFFNNFNVKKDRVGVIIGSGIGGLNFISKNQLILNKYGFKRISPFFIPGSIANTISGYISIKYGFSGPNLSVSTACASGSHSIGLGYRLILNNYSDVMIVGGSEKAITPLAIAGFHSIKSLSTNNNNPKEASRPWDERRDGFVLGDGSGVIVLEEYQHAISRGAYIYAELTGFGMNADAFHITRPSKNGDGAFKSMMYACIDSKIKSSEINYINAHGTSTLIGDLEESIAIEKLIGHKFIDKTFVTSTKSMTGHLLGAAGAIESIFTVLSIRDQIIPPTINLNKVGKNCNLNYVRNKSFKTIINCAMNNSFGFGGTNSSLIFKKIS